MLVLVLVHLLVLVLVLVLLLVLEVLHVQQMLERISGNRQEFATANGWAIL